MRCRSGRTVAGSPGGGDSAAGSDLAGPEHRGVWERRRRQVERDPAEAGWVTGVTGDEQRGIAVASSRLVAQYGFAAVGEQWDDVDGLEISYEIDAGPTAQRG